ELRGYIVFTNRERQKGTIILVHGIRASKEHFLPLCKLLSDSGYNSAIIDLRAHGESEGKYCTYGFYEKTDLRLVIDFLLKTDSLNANLGIWGQSLGGAVSLQTLAIDPRLKFGIVESTFADFRTIVHDYVDQRIGFDIPFLTNYMIWRAEGIADFESKNVVPSKSANSITQPVLIVHGSKDDRIKYEYGLQNFNSLAGIGKEFLGCPEANHLNVWESCGEKYFENVLDFIDRNNSDQ
ncbi:MAG: hypothetical protein C0490_07710, partial [Marivirga sp.]|nr:hypothetical protein [Marivirga sp.]